MNAEMIASVLRDLGFYCFVHDDGLGFCDLLFDLGDDGTLECFWLTPSKHLRLFLTRNNGKTYRSGFLKHADDAPALIRTLFPNRRSPEATQ